MKNTTRTKDERLHDLEEEIENERKQPIYSGEEKRILMNAIRKVSKVRRKARNS